MTAYPSDILEHFSLRRSAKVLASSKDSFFDVFSDALRITEQDLATRLRDPSNSELFEEMMKHEFGSHRRWIDLDRVFANSTFIPVLAMVAAVSQSFNKRIILICDDNNLGDIHQGSNGIVLHPSRVVGDEIVCWLTDSGLFNEAHLSDRRAFDAAIDALPESSILLIDSVPEVAVQVGEEPEAEIEEDAGVEAPVTFADYPSGPVEIPKMSIQLYMERFTGGRDSRPTREAYSNPNGIDFVTSDYRMESENAIEFEKTADIDGFFACIKPAELAEVIACGGTVVKSEEVFLKHTINSVRKVALDATGTSFPVIKAVKFGFLNKDEQMEVLFCFGSDEARAFNYAQLVENAHQVAKEFPCIESGCPISAEHRSLRSSRPLNLRQIQGRTFNWDYNARNFGCILKHASDHVIANTPGRVTSFVIIRAIGTKFKLMNHDPSKVHEMLDDLLIPFNRKMFLKENGPRAFVDFSLKFLPFGIGNEDTVRDDIYLKLFY